MELIFEVEFKEVSGYSLVSLMNTIEIVPGNRSKPRQPLGWRSVVKHELHSLARSDSRQSVPSSTPVWGYRFEGQPDRAPWKHFVEHEHDYRLGLPIKLKLLLLYDQNHWLSHQN